MSNLSTVREKPISVGLKIGLCAWMGAVMFVFLVLFGPPEFWSVVQRLGIVYGKLCQLQVWLQSFFTAGYLS
jgi:hypothetical protein